MVDVLELDGYVSVSLSLSIPDRSIELPSAFLGWSRNTFLSLSLPV
jgi:hypothetical protein